MLHKWGGGHFSSIIMGENQWTHYMKEIDVDLQRLQKMITKKSRKMKILLTTTCHLATKL